jgi:superfamily I DNA/RNA helicase
MVITTADRVEAQREALEEKEIDVGGEDGVEVVDFWQAKGLEMEAVFVYGIEDLYRTSQNEMLFGGTKEKKKSRRRLRRIIYVALTRPLEQLIIYYEDQNQSAIDELLTIASDIEKSQST